MKPQPEPLPVEMLATSDERRARVTIEEHAAFQRAISRPCDRFDEIDDELDEHIVCDPYEPRLPRRSEKEVSRVLALLDDLQPERTSH
jgi:hypothetical protein